MAVLAVQRVVVGPACVDALVCVPEHEPLRTSIVPDIVQRAVDILPGLTRHSCDNGTAHGILGELADTETPHLLEHVAFELMALSGSPRTLAGETTWDFAKEGPGVFHVRLAYDDDLVALGALREGVHVVRWLMGDLPQIDPPDIAAVVARLRALRKRPA